jgi:superfamily I DNA/RNA helicase
MNFRIADTFTDSLARLNADEQKAAKTTAFDLQMNPASPGLSFHRLDKAKDKNFWSVRVNGDVRLIVHRSSDSMLLCYVDHHDRAYDWAERRKLETHPKTGAAQLVEIRETVKEVIVPVYRQQELSLPAKRLLFADKSDDELLGYGVPKEWLGDVKQADEDSLLILADRLPAEAAEALLEVATGGKPRVAQPVSPATNPFDHPDAQRRFRVMSNVEELERALEFPWEKWTIFLHPEQRELVEREYTGPAKVSGSAGTGKTIVALHRAVHLARKNPSSRILLATFSEPLAKALGDKMRRLIGSEPRLGERIDVHSLDLLVAKLLKVHFRHLRLVEKAELRSILAASAQQVGTHPFSDYFLASEWDQVVDAWQLQSWEDYRDVVRLGRKTRLPESHRKILWEIFERTLSSLSEKGLLTLSGAYRLISNVFQNNRNAPFDYAVIDEAQDLSVAQLRFLASLSGGRPEALFFAGDLGQRIFQQPFSWKSLGVDIRGRSRQLRINYRTSHQIRQQADRLLGPELTDPDGNQENRSDTISVFNGPLPEISIHRTEEEEASAVGKWIAQRIGEGISAHEIAIFVRSEHQIERAKLAAQKSEAGFLILDEHLTTRSDYLATATMHLAKGLEFRAVIIMACDDEVVPFQERIETVGDDADLQEVYDTERQLLYVACTRARDRLLITAVSPASEFLDDML